LYTVDIYAVVFIVLAFISVLNRLKMNKYHVFVLKTKCPSAKL